MKLIFPLPLPRPLPASDTSARQSGATEICMLCVFTFGCSVLRNVTTSTLATCDEMRQKTAKSERSLGLEVIFVSIFLCHLFRLSLCSAVRLSCLLNFHKFQIFPTYESYINCLNFRMAELPIFIHFGLIKAPPGRLGPLNYLCGTLG